MTERKLKGSSMHKDIVPLEELTEQEIAQVGGAGKADPAKCSKNFNLPFWVWWQTCKGK